MVEEAGDGLREHFGSTGIHIEQVSRVRGVKRRMCSCILLALTDTLTRLPHRGARLYRGGIQSSSSYGTC